MKYPFQNPQLPLEERAQNLVDLMTLEEKAGQLLHEAMAVPRLGIPQYNWWNECLHGVARAGKATIFPQAIGMAAAFDKDLMETIASAIAIEARAKFQEASKKGNTGQYNGLTFWTPNVNLFRDPRWGRGQETYGESPYLSGALGKAFVKGLQGEDPDHLKTAACAKHFAVHSGPEALRHEFDAQVSPKDLRETYLPAFKTLVTESGVEAVMGAYNRVNGEPACGSPTLLQDILREEWGFQGHVVSDCWAIRDFHQHHKVTSRPEESVALALNSGCDLNCGCTYEFILKAHKEGLISTQEIDRSLKRLMITRIKLGLFDPKESNPYRDLSPTVVDSPEHRELARKAAVKSMVLLKNNGILPLSSGLNRIYVTGPNASNIDALLGNYYGSNPRIVTPLEGIAAAVDQGVTVDYRPGTLLTQPSPNPIQWAVFEAKQAEVTIAVMGMDSTVEGEEGDAIASVTKGDRDSLDLPEQQLQFLRDLKEQNTPLVVVMLAGSPYLMEEVHQLADAVLWGWYPGEEGGNALADILFGKASPSGKLPLTFPKTLEQLPPFEDYAMKGRTFRYMTEEPQYPFGYGLSYTSWEITQETTSQTEVGPGEELNIKATITNTGKQRGEQVIQLYLSHEESPFPLPLYELRGFANVALNPGESQTLEFTLRSKDLEVINPQGEAQWLPGQLTLHLGCCLPSSRGRELDPTAPVTLEVTKK